MASSPTSGGSTNSHRFGVMRAYVVQRLILALFLALGSASLVFFMINLPPGTWCWRRWGTPAD